MHTDPEAHPPDEEMVPGLSVAAQAIDDRSRFDRLKKGLLVSIFTVALLAMGAEALLRLSGDRERAFQAGVNRTLGPWVALMQARIFEEIPDPVRRYAMRPGAHCEVEGWSFRVSGQRTRGADFAPEKPAGEKRLLCLGDSFCFGMWADEDETLVGHLTRMANEAEEARGSTTRWRAANLGVPGYHSGQQLRAFEQDGLALDPDAVVLYYNTNDIDREGFFYDGELGALRNDHIPLPVGLRRTLWNSHLYGRIARMHDRVYRKIPEAHLDPRVPWANVREDNKRATRKAIVRIAALCRERDIPLFFVNQPLWTWSGTSRASDWNVLPLVEWAEELRRELELPGLSLLGLLRGYGDGHDRFAEAPGEPPPPDLIVDAYIADLAVREAFRIAREKAQSEGGNWEELPIDQRLLLVASSGVEVPEIPDFHLTGEGYGHIARLCYPRMQAAGMVP